ncbi:hypothetical protein [Streptomyces prunicolor]
MPSIVFPMLRYLEVRLGERVLEIGTETGYNAALLGIRLGRDGSSATCPSRSCRTRRRNRSTKRGASRATNPSAPPSP